LSSIDSTFKLDHICWSLYFLKVYSTIDVCSSYWKVSPKTFSRWVWKFLRLMASQDLVDINDRFSNGIDTVNMALDVIECPIQRPIDYYIQCVFYSGKAGCHTIKYEIGTELSTGLIVWFHGGIPGSYDDLNIARSSGILLELRKNEYVFADTAFIGEEKFITPYKNPQTGSEHMINQIVHTRRVIVDKALNRINNFSFTQREWRHNIEYHQIAMEALVNILNIDLKFKPIR